MKISGTIRDHQALIHLPPEAKPLPTGAYVFQLKGLPLAWTEAHATSLLKAWARKHNYTALTVKATSANLSKWNARIQFYAPKPVSKSYLHSACAECGASIHEPCKGTPKGAFHTTRAKR